MDKSLEEVWSERKTGFIKNKLYLKNNNLPIQLEQKFKDKFSLAGDYEQEAREAKRQAEQHEAQARQHEVQAGQLREDAQTYRLIAQAYTTGDLSEVKKWKYDLVFSGLRRKENFKALTFDQKPLRREKPFEEWRKL